MPFEQLKPSGFLSLNSGKVQEMACEENRSKVGSEVQREEALPGNLELLECGKEMHKRVGPPGTGHQEGGLQDIPRLQGLWCQDSSRSPRLFSFQVFVKQDFRTPPEGIHQAKATASLWPGAVKLGVRQFWKGLSINSRVKPCSVFTKLTWTMPPNDECSEIRREMHGCCLNPEF